MTKLFEKYELFKGSLKQKKLEPKEYQKMVKDWMNQNEGRKRKKRKNRKIRNGATAPFFLLKKYKKRLLFVLEWCMMKKIK